MQESTDPPIHRMLPLQSDKIGGGGLTMLHPRSPHSSILSLSLTKLLQFSGTTRDTIPESARALRWLTNLTRRSQQQRRQAALFIQYLMDSPFILDLPPSHHSAREVKRAFLNCQEAQKDETWEAYSVS